VQVPLLSLEIIRHKSQRAQLTRLYRFDVMEALSRTRRNGRSKSGTPKKNLTPRGTRPTAVQALGEEIATSPVIEQDSVAKESLVQFFRHGIRSQSWSPFDDLIRARMCYIGTPLSNLFHLVHEERCDNSTNLHYPIPPIRRAVSWKPDPGLLSLGNSQDAVQGLPSFQ
jgi:hypothetical protein